MRYQRVLGDAEIQGSDAWKALRYDKYTASEVGALFALHPYRTALQIAEEKLSRKSPDVSPEKQFLFERGHEAEYAGREWLRANMGLVLDPAVVISIPTPDLLASLDGFGEHKNAPLTAEMKYMGREKVKAVANGEIPAHHSAQVQAQLYVTGAERCIYFAMDPDGKAEAIEIKPDTDFQSEIVAKVTEFMTGLRAGKLPEPTDRDVVLIDDPRFRELARLDGEVMRLKAQYDALETTLLGEYEKHGRIQAGPVSVTRYFQKGNVDYSKVPQLKGVDLDRYRKAGSLRTKVTIKKETR